MPSLIEKIIYKTALSLKLRERSLRAARREQGLVNLFDQISEIVPDLTNQYSGFTPEDTFTLQKIRTMHAFQVQLALEAFELENIPETLIDVGDSSGNHLTYLKSLVDKTFRAVSLNTDSEAVTRIQDKGLEAIHGKAEDLENYKINPDAILLFETLEHLTDPIRFLYNLSSQTKCQAIILTVPYLRRSRVGLSYIRNNQPDATAENTHIFELSPEDWKLIFKHSGWEITYEKIYYQYPKWSPLLIMKNFWKRYDFEGFFGAILTRAAPESVRFKDYHIYD